MRWRSIEISFLTLDCHLWWNAKIQKSILSMKCQIYYNYEDESWPSGSQERRKDRLLCWSILHVPCSLAANLRTILVQGVFRHYVSPCSNKFLLEYLTLETDNNTGIFVAKRFRTLKSCLGLRRRGEWERDRRVGKKSIFLIQIPCNPPQYAGVQKMCYFNLFFGLVIS